jgi:hypothetical protein
MAGTALRAFAHPAIRRGSLRPGNGASRMPGMRRATFSRGFAEMAVKY